MQICTITPSQREADAAWLAERMASYTGTIQRVPGFERAAPAPGRPNWIDPETKLRRRRSVSPGRNLTQRIRALAQIEIDGVTITRSAAEIARQLREDGMRITSTQVEITAARNGIELRELGRAVR
jgi:hypothetical protein